MSCRFHRCTCCATPGAEKLLSGTAHHVCTRCLPHVVLTECTVYGCSGGFTPTGRCNYCRGLRVVEPRCRQAAQDAADALHDARYAALRDGGGAA